MDIGKLFQRAAQLSEIPIFYAGDTAVTLGGISVGVGIFIFSLLVSRIAQRILAHRLVDQLQLQPGIVYALRRFLHYMILFIGLALAFQCIGFSLGSIAVVLGFLSVGIGFGLQNITSNFISGLILLFERPINVGDMVSVEQEGKPIDGTVIKIKMRSTVIRTFDSVAIIVPNSHLIENRVVNWSIDDLRLRVHSPVGVAYGSDIDKVFEVLKGVAQSHPDVLSNPAPEIRFLGFGDSSLNFELLAWIPRPDLKWTILSQLNRAIDAGFRSAGIRIPFPQRDLHLQSTPSIERFARAAEASPKH